MSCWNNRDCPNGNQCTLGRCLPSTDHLIDKCNGRNYSTLIPPIVGAFLYDLPSLRLCYLFITILLPVIGIISNVVSAIMFSRNNIRRTTLGTYLIIYCLCNTTSMFLLLTNIITALYYKTYLFRLWACHGYSYLSLTINYTSILISSVIAIEWMLNNSFKFDRFRSRKQPILISLLVFITVLIFNIDKIFARRLNMNEADQYCCVNTGVHSYWPTIVFYICIGSTCLTHIICIVITHIRIEDRSFIEKLVLNKVNLIPSVFIVGVLICIGIYHFFSHSYITGSLELIIRLHVGFTFLFYMIQTSTCLIYVLPNHCFIARMIEFQVIHNLWIRRTSLELQSALGNLGDIYYASEIYKRDAISEKI